MVSCDGHNCLYESDMVYESEALLRVASMVVAELRRSHDPFDGVLLWIHVMVQLKDFL